MVRRDTLHRSVSHTAEDEGGEGERRRRIPLSSAGHVCESQTGALSPGPGSIQFIRAAGAAEHSPLDDSAIVRDMTAHKSF
jgi:hypothetical protein